MVDKVGPLVLQAGRLAVLEAAYAVPPRAYHDLRHVHEVLGHYASVAAGPGWVQPAEVQLAVLYHDAVHEPGRGDNEARSAELAMDHIARWLPDAGVDAARVAALIRLTARHGDLVLGDLAADPVPAEGCPLLDLRLAV